MKKDDSIAQTGDALRIALEREKALFNELSGRLAIEACVFRILSCERRLGLIGRHEARSGPPDNLKKKER